MDRNQKILAKIASSAKILEVGPSIGPIAPKAQGWQSFSIDCADREGLIEKYRGQTNVNTALIEEVDFVWQKGPIHEAIGSNHHFSFDACIASHVIEHMPNPIDFFRSLEHLLVTGGFVSLVVPDRRFCFDYFKPWTTTADWLYADYQGRSRHSKKSAFEMEAYSVSQNGECAWGQQPTGSLSFYVSLADAKKAFDERRDDADAPYADQHAWCFTPSSFALLVLELNALDAIDFFIDTAFPTEGCEFFVTLKRGRLAATDDAALGEQRLGLLKGIIREHKEQYDYLFGKDAATAPELHPIADDANGITAITQRLDQLTQTVAGAARADATLLAALEEQSKQLRKINAAFRLGKKMLTPVRLARKRLATLGARIH